MHEWDQCAFYSYILRVFLAYAHEACDLGRQGTWTVDHVSSIANEFLRKFTIEAHYTDGHDRTGEKFPDVTASNWHGGLRPDLERLFRKSEEWSQYEAKLLAIAEKLGRGPVSGPASDTHQPGSNPTKMDLGEAKPDLEATNPGNSIMERLTPQQQALLLAVVGAHVSFGGEPFIFVQHASGQALCYPGGRSISVDADEVDFVQLQNEGLIAFTKMEQRVFAASRPSTESQL